MNNNFSNKADNQDSQATAPKEIVASNTNQENDLRDHIAQIAQTAQGRVGVSATVLETGESVTLNGNQRFPMQSVYKFPIAMAVLAQVEQLRSCTGINKGLPKKKKSERKGVIKTQLNSISDRLCSESENMRNPSV